MKFRTDINGLRAYAVLAVVLFHFNKNWLPGGFAGVDIFFVISGFLMTGIIVTSIRNNNFSIIKFYTSRANRIIPSLAFLCLILFIFGWFFLSSIEYKLLAKHAASSILFVSNIIYWKETGYFVPNAHELWLLHTWSLSVEWQFYIIYPIVLVFLAKVFHLEIIKKIIVVSTILSIIFSIYASYKWNVASYFLLPTRMWEMLIGGIAFLYPFEINKQSDKNSLEILGITLIMISFFLVNENTVWPGYIALIPTLGTFIIIQANNNNSILTSNIVSQKLGKWSYSIYLWHWPIVVIIYTYNLSIVWSYLGILFSILLGLFSYTYIESIKFKNILNLKAIYKCVPLYFSIIIVVLSSVIYVNNGKFSIKAVSNKDLFIESYQEKHKNLTNAYWLKCNTYTSLLEKKSFETDPSCITSKGNGGVFLWGDSHAEALSLGIRNLLQPYNIPFYQKTSAGCRASLDESNMQGIFKEACDYSNKLALEKIKELQPDIVVIAQANSHDLTDWHSIAMDLKKRGVKRILLIGPVSQWQPSLPKVMISNKNWNTTELFISDAGLDLSILKTESKMKVLDLPHNIEYISLINSLCKLTELNQYSCRVKINDDQYSLLQVDYGHLSEEGSIFVVDSIIKPYIIKYLHL